jgi:multiple sugar transport system substrate-binding protein
LADLSSVVKSSDFISNVAKQFTTDGKLYAAPKVVSTLAIYVNKGIFEKAGIDETSIPKSWEDFITWAPTAQAKLDAAYGAGKVKLINVNADLNRNWQFIEADGKNPITSAGKSNFSDATILKNLGTVQQLFNTGAVATPKDMGQGDEGAGFGNGVFAMALTGNWNVVQLNTNFSSVKYDVIPNLTYKDVKQTMMYTVGWGESKSTKNASLASKWISYVTSKSGMATLTEGVGTLPSREDVASASSFFKSNPALQVHQAELSYATPWQDGTNLSTIATSYNNFIVNAFKKGATDSDLKTALKSTDDDANSKISK